MEYQENVKNIILEHLEEQRLINVSLLSKQLYLDRTQVYRKIKKATGISVAAFIRDTKLDYGKGLLLSRKDTIATVAYLSGFTNVHYFIRCFKQKYELTPAKFRIKNTYAT